MKEKLIAIIPARSGSKGLKDKNVKLLDGKPLLAYSVLAAKESGIFDEIFVSTDSRRYAETAVKYGANVPFLRSAEISGDSASTWDAVKEALENYAGMGKLFDYVCVLQPTSPLRDKTDIINSYKLLIEKQAKSVVSVCEVEHSPLWCNTLDESLSLVDFIDEKIDKLPRQALPIYYRLNGSVYWVKCDFLIEDENIYREKSYAFKMSAEKSVDIDTELDFKLAEVIIKSIKG